MAVGPRLQGGQTGGAFFLCGFNPCIWKEK